MTLQEEALEVIADIYDAALQPERWPRALRKVEAFVGGSQPLMLAPLGERERMQVLVPHLVRAAQVMYRLREAKVKSVGALAALEELACGVLMLDERGAVTFCHQAARRTLAEEDGLKLRQGGPRDTGGRLFASDLQVRKALDSALEACLRQEAEARDCSRGIRVPRTSNRPDYVLQITSLATRTDLRPDQNPAAAIVFISDPDSELVVDESLLRRRYGLTPAETRLAQLLLNGETLASAAKHLGVGETTAKTQLQHMFQKTRTHRQPELVKLLLTVVSVTSR
jgi:DNA-binding CsgD family transcriptional regulator